MKRYLLFVIVFLMVVICCTPDNDSYNLSISKDELEFTPKGGELIVKVTSVYNWECKYDADWLLVRQQANRIRVIADENPTSKPRSEVIEIMINGAVENEIVVTQYGTELNIENKMLSVGSFCDTLSVSVITNSLWTFEHQIEWCTIWKDESNLFILVDRNYSMDERCGTIVVNAGDLSYELEVCQAACQWYNSFELVDVEGGTFFMGAQNNDSESFNYDASAYQIEAPVHEVSMTSYAIGKFEVTQAQWIAAMGTNPSVVQGDSLPVENVTWEQVQEFISILNENSGLSYRLPTEAEWEFASRGGNKSHGFSYSGYSVLGACGWYYSNSAATTHKIGNKTPNELGIYDMSGNVREWCNDWFGYYSPESVYNPQGAEYGSVKVNRGGSWTTPAVNCRNSYRHTDYPYEAAHDLGFRLVLPVD